MSDTDVVKWEVPEKVLTVEDAISAVLRHLPKIAPRNLNLERFKTMLNIELSKIEHLEECAPLDAMKIIADIASLGLEPGNEVILRTFYSQKEKRHILNKLVGFQGWYRILVESPRIRKVVTDVVCKGDEFFQDRMNDEYRHVVPQEAPRAEVTHAYCVVTLDNGERLYRVLDKHDLDRHRKSAQGAGEYGPWKDHYSVMAMKSALQDFASRHRGLINAIAKEALAQDESAMAQEYQLTGTSPARYEEAVNLLYGDDEPRNQAAWNEYDEVRRDRLPRQSPPRYFGVNPETGVIEGDDDPEPEPDITADIAPSVSNETEEESDIPAELPGLDEQSRIMRLHADVEALMRGKNFKRSQVTYLMKECGAGNTTFEYLRDLAVLRQMHQRLAPDPGVQDGQSELIKEKGEAS